MFTKPLRTAAGRERDRKLVPTPQVSWTVQTESQSTGGHGSEEQLAVAARHTPVPS